MLGKQVGKGKSRSTIGSITPRDQSHRRNYINPTPKNKGRKRRIRTGSKSKGKRASSGTGEMTKISRGGEQESTASEEGN